MKPFRIGWLFPCLAGALSLHAQVTASDRVVLCGDSITEQRTYTAYVEDYLLMCAPQSPASFTQLGWSGETVQGLIKRAEVDVAPFHPSVATTFYGMNDGGYKPSSPATVAAFEQSTVDMIRLLRAEGIKRVIVGSPGAVDTEAYKTWFVAHSTPQEYNTTLADLGKAAQRAAQKEGAEYYDIHRVMMDGMAKAKAKYGESYLLASDGVHPSGNGQIIIAYAILRAMGYTGEVATLTVDAQTGVAEASAGQRVVSSGPGHLEIESTRYPFCFVDRPESPVSSRAMVDCLPFNEDLNRFVLVLKRAPKSVKLTWGAQSRIVSGDELQRGVNLAALFLDNPFGDAFARVHTAVSEQQSFEIPGVKVLLEGLAQWRTQFPDDGATYDRLRARILERDQALYEAARRAVQPVRHTIEWAPASP
jgi:lysophospholipase L1-like esterase